LEILDLFDDPRQLIEVIPEVCGTSSIEVTWVMEKLHELVLQNRTLSSCVIGALCELPNLNADQKQQISELSIAFLTFVQENDVPVLVRTLLRTISKRNGNTVIDAVRSTCAQLDADLLQLICTEVLSTAFSVNSVAVSSFLAAFKNETNELSSFDVLVILTLLNQRDRNIIFSTVKSAFNREILKLDILVDAIKMANHRFFANSVYTLAMYFIHNATLFKSGNVSWAHPVCIYTYVLFSEKQTSILSALLSSLQKEGDCVANDVLVTLGISHSEDLSNHASMIEDALSHAVDYSPLCLHSICFALTSCFKHNPNLVQHFYILLRKCLFSGQESSTRIGIIAATHVITNPEFDQVLEWVLQIMRAKVDQNTIHILDLLNQCLESLEDDRVRYIFERFLYPMMKSISFTAEKTNDAVFAYKECKVWSNRSL
jgi:hypothetical protein